MIAAGTSAIQICNGLAAGNIGDELMNRAFWDALPEGLALAVEVFPHHRIQRAPYPPPHQYVELDWAGLPATDPRGRPGLLVGDTPVTESLGLDWPLRFLAPRLDAFHGQGLPVDALGVGVEPVNSREGRTLFRRSFLPIRSWTVRSERCRRNLSDLGVPADRVAVGADWAWLHRPRAGRQTWADETWRGVGVDPSAPLLVVNAVHERWRERETLHAALAEVLDILARHGFQVAFFCNEVREGEFYDRAAALRVAGLMAAPAVHLPNLYYAPDEALALLARATVTVSSRYHFTVQSVLAGAVPVTLSRSDKMDGLLEDLGQTAAGTFQGIDVPTVVAAVQDAAEKRAERRAALATRAASLGARARHNLDLWPGSAPVHGSRAV